MFQNCLNFTMWSSTIGFEGPVKLKIVVDVADFENHKPWKG